MRYDSTIVVEDVIDPKTKVSVTSGKFIARTLMYVGIGLAVTFVVLTLIATPLYFIFAGSSGFVGIETLATVIKNGNLDVIEGTPAMFALATYGVLLVISSIAMIAMMIWINISMIAKGKVRLVPYLIYAATMGVFLASFSLVLPFYDILLAIGITTVVFAMMAGVAFLLGDKAKWLGIIGIGLALGTLLLSLLSIPILIIFWNSPIYIVYYFAFSILTFISMLFITAFDFYRMRTIAKKGYQSNDLALYCAFNLYVDFIYILIRILSLLARSRK